MKFLETAIAGVKVIEPRLFGDSRGYFFEAYREDLFAGAGIDARFIQDNESFSTGGVLRGLHYQIPPYTQAKLVRVVSGRVLDVVVDIRLGSPTFGKHVGIELSGESKRQLFLPRGMAHGFGVLSPEAVFVYKCDNFYCPASERCIRFDDPALGIDWRLPPETVKLSPRDRRGVLFKDAELFEEY